MSNKLTIVYTYYGQAERIPGILKELHPESRVVIVDDHSKRELHIVDKPKNIDVYRIDTDIKWNQGGARNLGFQESKGWIVCADIDHLIPREAVEQMIKLRKRRGNFYFLGRRDHPNGCNLFLIHKDDYELIGGFDEDFAGNYGYEDLLFLTMCQKRFRVKKQYDIQAIVYAAESSTKRLSRNLKANKKLIQIKQFQLRNNGERIRFKWHKL